MASTSTTAFHLNPGQVLAGKYRVEANLGFGWEGEVYRVVELKTGIARALKIFFPERNVRDQAARFYATKLYALRDCPIVVQYLHSEDFRLSGRPVTGLVSEFVEGELLSRFIARQRGHRLPAFEALNLLHALTCGVEPIHARREYHGDIHDENVLVRRKGIGFEVRLVDFFRWGRPTRAKIAEDVIMMTRLLYDAVGGRRHYARQPLPIKRICLGLRRDLVSRRFPTASHLRAHLESFEWSG